MNNTVSQLADARRRFFLCVLCAAVAACSNGVTSDELAPGPGVLQDLTGGLDTAVSVDTGADSGSDTCDPACPAGYVCVDTADLLGAGPGRGPTCVVAAERACAPCNDDSQCQGGACVTFPDGDAGCLIPCIAGAIDGTSVSTCPEGFACSPGRDGDLCRPSTGSCSCAPGDLNATRSCTLEVDSAGCEGEQTCTADGWAGCDAKLVAEEVCNGLDDDCDGLTDEDGSPEGEPALPGGGACTSVGPAGTCTGVRVCAGTAGWRCEGPDPAPELCNGLDDDCDGATDEPWLQPGPDGVGGAYTASNHCGVCGNACADQFANGTGGCITDTSPPHCEAIACDPGYVLEDGACVPPTITACTPCQDSVSCGPGFACVPWQDSDQSVSAVCAASCLGGGGCPLDSTACQSLDGGAPYCLPTADVCTCDAGNNGSLRACARTNEQGSCAGTELCLAGQGWQTCDAPVPAAEVCNGDDDDCDGKVDEDVGVGETCPITNAWGTCDGLLACNGASGLSCEGTAPAPETCNSLDDDCDGAVDEGFADPVTGAYLQVEHCGGCNKQCPEPKGGNAVAACAVGSDGEPACSYACLEGFVDADGLAGNGCECTPAGAEDLPDGVDQNCDGVDGEVDNAVFVAKWGAAINPGTPAAPLSSVADGVALAASSGKRDVYVATGAYSGTVQMAAGVSVYGGYNSDFSARDPVAFETTLLGAGKSAPWTVRCEGLSVPSQSSRLDGLTIIGPAATSPGVSSYGVVSVGCGPAFMIAGCTILGGAGATGLAGEDGGNGSDGASGLPGAAASDIGHPVCDQDDHKAGGEGGMGVCGATNGIGGTNVAGGNGGAAICPDFNETVGPPQCSIFGPGGQQAKNAELGKGGKGPSPGAGGEAGLDAYTDPHDGVTTQCAVPGRDCESCTVQLGTLNGKPGKAGTDGAHGGGGGGAVAGGSVGADGVWNGNAGADGGVGAHGSGGGGGGAAGGVETISCEDIAGFTDVGGSGGGGGAGGCAGTAGTGGGPGGGGFGVVIVVPSGAAPPLLEGNTIAAGQGGAGGAGGDGGAGGVGGFGAPGGADAVSEKITKCANGGGSGGNGGNGGAGGGGGGGAGGPSVGVATVGVSEGQVGAWQGTNTINATDAAGPGGDGGASAGVAGGDGADGISAAVVVQP